MYKYALIVIISILVSSHISEANQSPVVSNVRAQQRPGTKLVDITYDVIDNDNDPLNIELQLSNDEGQTFSVPAVTLSEDSDVGSGITPGTGKRIVWDAGKDVPNAYGTNYVAKIVANDGSVANIIYYRINTNDDTEIYELTPDGENLTKLFTFSSQLSSLSPSFPPSLRLSPDKTKIAFIGSNGLNIKNLNSPLITETSEKQIFSIPFWSSDSKLIFVIPLEQNKIISWNVETRTASVITSIPNSSYYSSYYNRSGASINTILYPSVFDVSEDLTKFIIRGGVSIYVIDTNNNTQKTYGGDYARISPDNNTLLTISLRNVLFHSDEDYFPSMLELNSTGTSRLSQQVSMFDFSPDGTQVAYVQSGILYKMNLDGTNLIQLTKIIDKNIYYLSWK